MYYLHHKLLFLCKITNLGIFYSLFYIKLYSNTYYFLIYVDLHLSTTSVVLNDSSKTIGENLTSVTQEPPVQENTSNISYIGKLLKL